jgi:TfoX/Sxy family transcriptional regulator of competence genes
MVAPLRVECNSNRRYAIRPGVKKKEKKPATPRARRPPPLHQGTFEEAVERLGLPGVTSKRLFGGLCYYVEDKPFAILLGGDLALKLPGETLRTGCARGDGRIFNPGGGDFFMREYITLSDQALMDEAQIDTYVLASHRFIAGRSGGEAGGLGYEDLLHGRDELYKRKQ